MEPMYTMLFGISFKQRHLSPINLCGPAGSDCARRVQMQSRAHAVVQLYVGHDVNVRNDVIP